MPFYDVELEGPEVEWAHRDHPDFWTTEPERDTAGQPVPGTGMPRKVVKKAYAVVTLEADDKDDASALALRREYDAGYRKVLKVTERKR